jgi:hypothetical protein
MNAAAFDTLKFARALREKAQLSNEQAEGFPEAITDAFRTELATRGDVEAVRADLREGEQRRDARWREGEQRWDAKLREAELRLEAKIEATKSEIIKWMFGTIGFQTLIVLGAVIALARLIRA